MSDIVVSANQVSKTYGSFTALKAVNLKVKRGDILGLVGDNGAGKSTLLKLFTGLAFTSSGEVTLFDGHSKKDISQQLKRTGTMIEQPGFFPQLSIEKNLEYYRMLKGVPGKKSVAKVLETINLSSVKNKKAKTLSMGMKQRLGLGIALLGDPELLVLDEPINGLDPSGIIEMRNLFLKLNRERNITILISSHNLPELEQLATVYAFLDKGTLLEQVSARQLQERCQDFVDIAVSDPQQFLVLLEKQFVTEQFLVLSDQTIRVINPQHEIERYSSLASSHGLEISKLQRRKASLEQYFQELKERGAA